MTTAQPGQEQRMETKIVPREPTEKMLRQGRKFSCCGHSKACAYDGWQSMFDAAPARPTADLGEDGEIARVSEAILAEIRRQTGGNWPMEMESGHWLVDDTIDIEALARAVLSRSGL